MDMRSRADICSTNEYNYSYKRQLLAYMFLVGKGNNECSRTDSCPLRHEYCYNWI